MSRIKTLKGGSGGRELIQSRARYRRGGVTLRNKQPIGMTYGDRDCLDGEVELWDECYDIATTTELTLTGNNLSGPIPSEIGQLVNLTSLNLWYNYLTGPIPPEIGNLTNLTELVLQANQLTGEIPPEIGNLTNLAWLRLGDNQLTGTIPPGIGNLTNLVLLTLSYNSLTGEIPPEIGYLSNLAYLYLRNNQFMWIPESICELNFPWGWDSIPEGHFNITNNHFCLPYPECIVTHMGEQDISDCPEKTGIGHLDIVEPGFGGGYGGCTEPKAVNYNPQADFENGSCEFFEMQIKVGIQWEDAHTTDLVLKFGFSPETVDWEDIPPTGEEHCYPAGSNCLSYTDEPDDADTGHGYSSGNYYLEDWFVPSYAPVPWGFHAALGTEWTGSNWFWINWLNYSLADYGVEHKWDIYIDLPGAQYLMSFEVACDIKFDWLAQHWNDISQYIESMRLTDALDGALGIDIDVEDIINSPSQSYRWHPEINGVIAHLHVIPRDPESR